MTHSSQVITVMGTVMAGVREAESGLRGYVLTENPQYALSFDRKIERSISAYEGVLELAKDNPAQMTRAFEIGQLLSARIDLLREHLAMAQQQQFEEVRQAFTEGPELDSMNRLNLATEQFLAEERRLQIERVAAMEGRVAWGSRLTLVVVPLMALLSLGVFYFVIQGIQGPITVLTAAMSNVASGDLNSRISHRMGSREFNGLARGYNQMVDHLAQVAADKSRSEQELHQVHDALLASAALQQERREAIELLGEMAHRMQAARTDQELSSIIKAFAPRVLPGLPGVLYTYNNSRNLLVPLAVWGEHNQEPESFAPKDCWGLRRGQSHCVTEAGNEVVCDHVADETRLYHCEPLLASGEVIGTLYVDGVVDAEYSIRMNVLTENIASAMVNQRLQRDLKEQTIRDPLTGLFNRRYMEEALVLEVARAARSGTPLTLVMCDVDHFKRFNDDYGHDAGDVVLQAVGAELGKHFRDGDIVCRYGGEEFTIIAPSTTPEALINRLEALRIAISKLSLRHERQTLGSLNVSFGVASWQAEEDLDRNGHAAMRAADAALYRAKLEGRNRVVLA